MAAANFATAVGLGPEGLEDHVRYCLRAAILTRLGERRLSPTLGSTASTLLWRPLEAALRMALETSVRDAIVRGEPRVALEAVDIEGDRSDAARLQVHLKYRILASNKRDRLEVVL